MIILEKEILDLMRKGDLTIYAMASVGLANAGRLARVADLLAEIPDEDAQSHAAALGEYLSSAARGLTLDRACGLTPPTHCDAWWIEEAKTERERLIIELVQSMPAEKITTRRNIAVKVAKQYAAISWPRERHLDAPPPHRIGTPQEILFRLHKLPGTWPLGETSIYKLMKLAGF